MKTLGGIWLDRHDGATLQDQVVRQIKDLIQRGALRPWQMLPSSRELALQLRISRNTVVYAYDRLISECYAESRSGVFVCSLVALPRRGREASTAKQRKTLDPETGSSGRVLRAPVPFRPCQPDVALFPLLHRGVPGKFCTSE